jgi:hypothetical protein
MNQHIIEEVGFDEQGEVFPPELCPLVRIRQYGGEDLSCLNGALGVLNGYECGFFEVTLVVSRGGFVIADPILCSGDEVEPLNELARDLKRLMPESFSKPGAACECGHVYGSGDPTCPKCEV